MLVCRSVPRASAPAHRPPPATRAAPAPGPREPESWSLDWSVPANDPRVPLFYCKQGYDAKREKRSSASCVWTPAPRAAPRCSRTFAHPPRCTGRMGPAASAPKSSSGAAAEATQRKRSRDSAASGDEATPQKRQRAPASASKRGRGGSARGGRRASGGRSQTPSPGKSAGTAAAGAAASAGAGAARGDEIKSLKKQVAEAKAAQRKAEKENQQLTKEREKLRKLVSSIQGVLQ